MGHFFREIKAEASDIKTLTSVPSLPERGPFSCSPLSFCRSG